MRFATTLLMFGISLGVAAGCTSDDSANNRNKNAGGSSTGTSTTSTTPDGAGGAGGGGGFGGTFGGTGPGPIDPGRDASIPETSMCVTCNPPNGQYCGIVGNNCGNKMNCGDCTQSGFSCGGSGVPNLCGASPDSGACTPTACDQPTGKYCGVVGDQCGGKIDCGGCSGGYVCGGAGQNNVCGAGRDSGACTPTQCQQASGKYCGKLGDQCGGEIDCGGCTGGLACGGAGTPGVCGAARDSGACTPTTCVNPGGTYCGKVGDACGSEIDCGACPAGEICGMRFPGVCAPPCPLCPMIPQCEGGTTTISGTVVTGALTNPDPIYNAVVFIPNVAPGTKLPPFTDDGPGGQ
jgi:hypothetical protein